MNESLVRYRSGADEAPRVPGVAPARAARPQALLSVGWARHADEVRAAQRLRFRVFAEEMGARLRPPEGTPPGIDADAFDDHCEHLLVQVHDRAGGPQRVVGTYRVLMPAAAHRLGGTYTDTEFDLAALHRLRPALAELGRACVDTEFRGGGVMLLMWSALAEFMNANGIAAVVGCASVPLADGGHAAAALYRQLDARHGVPPAERVRPWLPLPIDALRAATDVEVPALVKGYLKCGGRVLGPPAWDPDFHTADLPMLLRLTDLPDAYRRRFMGD